MREIKNWNGHRVLAVSTGTPAAQDPARMARLKVVWALAHDLGMPAESMPCCLCPVYQATGDPNLHRCTHPRGITWAVDTDVAQGGCRQRVILAEEYIPLVQMRLGEQA